jgi:hypothetical protein
MKRHVYSLLLVGVALFVLFKGDLINVWYRKALAEILPGGVLVSYYKGTNFEELVTTRGLRELAWSYDDESPARGVPKDNYSIRYEGILHVPETAEYAFYLQSMEGARFYIDDALIVDRWGENAWAPGTHGSSELTKGDHMLRVELFKRTGAGAIRLKWAGGAIPANTVLATPYITKKERSDANP